MKVTFRSRSDSHIVGLYIDKACTILADNSQNLEHTAQFAGNTTAWRMSFPSDSVGLKLLQADQLVSASSRKLLWSSLQPGLSESLHCSLARLRMTLNSLSYFMLGKEEPSEPGQFQGLLGTLLLSVMKSFWAGLGASIPEEAVKH